MKNLQLCVFLALSCALAPLLSAGEKKAEGGEKPQFKSWSLRSEEKEAFTFSGRDVKIAPIRKTAMISVQSRFAVAPFDKVTLTAKFKGKGTLQLGFHVYSEKQYLTTFDGYRLLTYSPDDFTEVKYVHFVPADEGKYKAMKKAVPCIYLYGGTSGELRDFQWKIEKFSFDPDSPLSRTPPPEGTLPMQRQLILPEALYAVPGLECNVFFDNIFLSQNKEDFQFKVECPKGKADAEKWSYSPEEKDAGSFDWTVSVSDRKGNLVARKSSKLFVAPKDAGSGKEYTLLMFGDSIIGVTSFPKRVHALFQTPGNPSLVMVGTRPRKPSSKGALAHEGYPGWSWYYFVNKGPFVKQSQGYPVCLDVQGYFDRANKGKAPDFITVQLGVNDVFGRDDFRLPSVMAAMEQRMDLLLAELRKCAPHAVIALAYPTPASKNPEMTDAKRRAAVRRFQMNLFEYNYLLQKKFGSAGKNPLRIHLVPVGTSLDCVRNFAVKDHVHPTEAGGNQLGDALYAFLKYQMSLRK
ncbi:MAG: hypothetical protein J6A21_03235 [Lentisphaeria bacterium]|nr:hypothetical protein [Lentisphaeria bacterium]